MSLQPYPVVFLSYLPSVSVVSVVTCPRITLKSWSPLQTTVSGACPTNGKGWNAQTPRVTRGAVRVHPPQDSATVIQSRGGGGLHRVVEGEL